MSHMIMLNVTIAILSICGLSESPVFLEMCEFHGSKYQ